MKPHPEFLDPAYLSLIGRIAVTAGRLEFTLSHLLQDLINPDPRVAQLVTGPMPFSTTVHLVKKIAAVKLAENDPRLALLVEALATAEDAMQHRNQILHGSWSFANAETDDPVPVLLNRSRRGEVSTRLIADASVLTDALTRLQHAQSCVQLVYVRSMDWSGAFDVEEDGSASRKVDFPQSS